MVVFPLPLSPTTLTILPPSISKSSPQIIGFLSYTKSTFSNLMLPFLYSYCLASIASLTVGLLLSREKISLISQKLSVYSLYREPRRLRGVSRLIMSVQRRTTSPTVSSPIQTLQAESRRLRHMPVLKMTLCPELRSHSPLFTRWVYRMQASNALLYFSSSFFSALKYFTVQQLAIVSLIIASAFFSNCFYLFITGLLLLDVFKVNTVKALKVPKKEKTNSGPKLRKRQVELMEKSRKMGNRNYNIILQFFSIAQCPLYNPNSLSLQEVLNRNFTSCFRRCSKLSIDICFQDFRDIFCKS